MRLWLFALPMLTGLAACGDRQFVNVIDTNAISAVQHNIKRQLGLYAAASARPPTIVDKSGNVVVLRGNASDFACGRGNIDFDILSVKIDLTTSLETNGSAKIVVAAPFTGGSAGPSFGGSKDTLNTQEAVYNLWPALINSASPDVLEQPIPANLEKEAPIAAALLSLRNGLIASSMTNDPFTGKTTGHQPCYADYNTDAKNPGGDPGDSFKLGLVITGDINVGFEVKLTAIDLSASADRKSISGNTITVNFYQRGTYDIPTTQAAAPLQRPTRPKPGGVQVVTTQPALPPSPKTPEEVCKLYGANSWQCRLAGTGIGASLIRPHTMMLPREAP